MTDIQSQLQKTLGDGYTLERELGGGGMSRVFIADELSLGRKVVVMRTFAIRGIISRFRSHTL